MEYRNLSTQWAREARETSWDSFRALASPEPDGPTLSSRLAEAKSNSRIYPWLVLDATRQAAQEGDMAAIQILRPELQGLAQDDRIRVATPSGHQGMAAYVLEQLGPAGGSMLPQEYNNPEPSGPKIEIVVSLGNDSTYTIVAGLFQEQCPVGVAALLSWLESNRLAGQSARLIGTSGLTLSFKKQEVLEGEAAPATVMVERPYGLFHEEGALSLLQLPGQFGAQDPNALQLILADQFQSDGQSTVVGKVIEGLTPLKTALLAAGSSATISVTSARLL